MRSVRSGFAMRVAGAAGVVAAIATAIVWGPDKIGVAQSVEAAAVDWRSVELVDQKGERFHLNDFRDKNVILSFVFTGCSSYCPAQTARLSVLQAELDAELGRDAYEIVSVTLTPVTDGPKEMKAFADRFKVQSANWRFSTGAPEVVDRLVEATSTVVIQTNEPGQVDHTTDVFVLPPQGRALERYRGVPLDATAIKRTLLDGELS